MEFFAVKNQRLFDAILQERKSLNFFMLKKALRKKDIRINNQKISENCDVKIGDKITVYLPQKVEKKIDVVFEDKNILLAKKPQGMEVTIKDKTFFDSECLEEILNAKACHRLDKNTEGIVAFAKNEQAKRALLEAFKIHTIHKNYVAVVFGKIKKNGDFLQNYLKKEQNFAKIYDFEAKNSKIAKLEYKVIQQQKDLYLIDINLITGRFHQIRAQLAHHGIFVLGDEKYGDKEVNKKYCRKKQQLCAYKIEFEKMPAPLEYLNGRIFAIEPSFHLIDFDDKKTSK